MTSWNGRSSPGRSVVRDHLALQDRLARAEACLQQLDHVGELGAHPLLSPGEQLDLAVSGAMRLKSHAVVLVLSHALPAQPGEDLAGFGQSLRQHDAHRVTSPHPASV
jgi:hypothetical protein